jgi:hypothetical protein
MLVFEWILLQEIQTNCKNWIWKEKSVETSMCSHLGHQHVDHISMYDEYYYESHDLSLKFSRK